jgi:hypothetical protein
MCTARKFVHPALVLRSICVPENVGENKNGLNKK